jgi:hypothetical protein
MSLIKHCYRSSYVSYLTNIVDIVNSLTPVINFTCDYCDSKEVTKLSQLFQDTILQASLKRYPRHFSEVKANLLKNTLWVQLGLAENQNLQTMNSSDGASPAPLQKRSSFSLFGSGGRSNSVSSDTTAADSNESGAFNANDGSVPKELQDGYTYEMAFNICQSFVSESRTTLSLASSMFSSSMSNEVYIETRRTEINVKMFSHEESHEIARLMIRKYDRKNWYHCRYLNCSTRSVMRIYFSFIMFYIYPFPIYLLQNQRCRGCRSRL